MGALHLQSLSVLQRPREAGNDIDERGSSSLDEYTRDVEDPFNLDLEDVLFETGRLYWFILLGPMNE